MVGGEWRFEIVMKNWKESCVGKYNTIDNVDIVLGLMSRKIIYGYYFNINIKIKNECFYW